MGETTLSHTQALTSFFCVIVLRSEMVVYEAALVRGSGLG